MSRRVGTGSECDGTHHSQVHLFRVLIRQELLRDPEDGVSRSLLDVRPEVDHGGEAPLGLGDRPQPGGSQESLRHGKHGGAPDFSLCFCLSLSLSSVGRLSALSLFTPAGLA